MKGTVLVVDDHVRPRRALAAELEEEGYGVVEAGNGAEGWNEFCRGEPDVVITDLVMPKGDGQELLTRIRSRSEVPVILFTARGTMESAVAAIKAGADDFVSSDDTDVEDLVSLVHTAVAGRQGRPTLPHLDQRVAGVSSAMKRVRSRMMGVAPLRTPVLVLGEPGSGRGAVIHALHELGSTGHGHLAVIDCGRFKPGDAVPECTAYYLDHVERMSMAGQAFWSRHLLAYDERQFRDAPRIFASAHSGFRDLSRLPFDDYLRSLLLRFPLELPPLRERVEDVPSIADVLVRRISEGMGRSITLGQPAREYLRDQTWPRNITQLEQVLERAVAFCRERQIRRELLVEVIQDSDESLERIRKQHGLRERDELVAALQITGGNVSRTADRLGKSRGAIYRLIDKHGISLNHSR